MTIQEAIKAVVAGENLSLEQSRAVFTDIMSGKATDAQIAAFIVGLRMKGETVSEITGAASVMREKATRVLPENGAHLVDTCGTGGDGSNTFNISTAAAFVAAGAGALVAKHGNRSVSSRSGSADVLEALGIAVSAPPEKLKACLDTIGIAFLFAPSLHDAMKYAIGPRREIAVRTIFNVLGPLTNPSLAPHQLLGVFSNHLTGTMASVLNNMGTQRAFVVCGDNGLDEIALSGPTEVAEVHLGTVSSYSIVPEQFGLRRAPTEALRGGSPAENAVIVKDVLDGQKGPCRDIVVLNAAFALLAAGIVENPMEGIAAAAGSIDSGAARNKLELLAKACRPI
jgi:anthranilate phosphoribosyltransferase